MPLVLARSNEAQSIFYLGRRPTASFKLPVEPLHSVRVIAVGPRHQMRCLWPGTVLPYT